MFFCVTQTSKVPYRHTFSPTWDVREDPINGSADVASPKTAFKLYKPSTSFANTLASASFSLTSYSDCALVNLYADTLNVSCRSSGILQTFASTPLHMPVSNVPFKIRQPNGRHIHLFWWTNITVNPLDELIHEMCYSWRGSSTHLVYHTQSQDTGPHLNPQYIRKLQIKRLTRSNICYNWFCIDLILVLLVWMTFFLWLLPSSKKHLTAFVLPSDWVTLSSFYHKRLDQHQGCPLGSSLTNLSPDGLVYSLWSFQASLFTSFFAQATLT